ncbi:MAG: fumarate hydratase [Firmicutes bacterium]|nr:fumarate hydratase [Bacillota bacterium]
MAVREINAVQIINAVAQLCISANINADESIRSAICKARVTETSEPAKNALDMIIENMKVAETERMPLCQDTGMVVVFVDIGQDAHIVGSLDAAINEGVRQGYKEGYFRASVVADPVNRVNTKDNTPAVIHYNIVEGDTVKITVMPKGFGSENKSALKMLTPSAGIEGVKNFVIETVKAAGSSPCPPIIVGIGIGGTMEKAAMLSKQALCIDIFSANPDPHWADMERQLLQKINGLNIGASGFKGTTTALSVKILTYPTHIAGLPVAVNIGCHVARHKCVVL